MRSVPCNYAAVVAAAITAGLPLISGEHSALPLFSTAGALAGVCYQPETGPAADPSGEQPAQRDPAAPAPTPTAPSTPELAAPPPAAPNPADQREARVQMSDGRTFTGLLVEKNAEMVILRINNIPCPCPMKDVVKIDLLPTNQERFEQYKSALDPKDVKNRLNLAEWLRSVEMYSEALTELQTVLKIDDANPQARDLKILIEQQSKLRDAARKAPGVGPDGKAPEPKEKPAPFPLLTADQINQIRVYEINLADPPRMSVPRDAITKLMEQFAGDPLIPVSREGREAMFRKRPEQLVELMFKLRARDLYTLVRVQEDPRSMKLFRDDVNRGWLANFCATTDCHGGTDAGRLWLYNRHPNSDQTVYTNFLILDRFRIKATKGDRKGESVPLIDYAHPSQSPLLQLALPHDESLFPHPIVDKPGKAHYRPLFRSEDDSRFQRAIGWIGSMYLPRPDYRLDYVPPVPPAPPVAQQPRPEESAEDPAEPSQDR